MGAQKHAPEPHPGRLDIVRQEGEDPYPIPARLEPTLGHVIIHHDRAPRS